MKRYYLACGLLIIVAAAAIMAHFAVAGPAKRDQDRSDDLSNIETAISESVADNDRMPTSLAGLTSIKVLKRPLSDYSLEHVKIEQSKLSDSADVTYDLCADFETQTGDGTLEYGFTDHPQGRHCFKQTTTLSQ